MIKTKIYYQKILKVTLVKMFGGFVKMDTLIKQKYVLDGLRDVQDVQRKYL